MVFDTFFFMWFFGVVLVENLGVKRTGSHLKQTVWNVGFQRSAAQRFHAVKPPGMTWLKKVNGQIQRKNQRVSFIVPKKIWGPDSATKIETFWLKKKSTRFILKLTFLKETGATFWGLLKPQLKISSLMMNIQGLLGSLCFFFLTEKPCQGVTFHEMV